MRIYTPAVMALTLLLKFLAAMFFTGSLMRQRLDEDEMFNELYTLGKKGNMLVLKKSLFGTSVFYSGPAETFPLTDRRSLHFGKKKWDGGQLVYLEQK